MARNYNNMSVEEMVHFFGTVTRQRIQQLLKKFSEAGNEGVVAKILQAKLILRNKKYEAKYGYSRDSDGAATIWNGMRKRVGKAGAYKDCTIAWDSYIEFRRWAEKQTGFGLEDFELDKDILVKGNRVYGPDTCVFVPLEVNSLFAGCYNARRRGKYPIGVCYNSGSRSFVAQMSRRQTRGLNKYLGSFPTVEEAFACYKTAKEARIKELAEKWKDHIDPRAYEALLARTVEWDD